MFIIKTSMGDIHIELDTVNTPKTAENFANYAKNGFYDNTIIHRVINGFMIQGGGLDNAMNQKATSAPINNEAKSAKKNNRGTVSMARTSDPHSATAQFFINLVDNSFLDFSSENAQGYGYCVFGEVVEGMEIVDKIAKVPTTNRMGHSDVPVDEVTIINVHEV